MPIALRVHDNMMLLSAASAVNDIVDQLLLIVVILFGNKNILCAVRDTSPHCQISGPAAHYLDDTAALMGG